LGLNIEDCEKINNDSLYSWQEWVISNIGELLSITPSLYQNHLELVFKENMRCLEMALEGGGAFLADKIGVNERAIRNWVKGASPRMEHILRLSFWLQEPIMNLLTKKLSFNYNLECSLKNLVFKEKQKNFMSKNINPIEEINNLIKDKPISIRAISNKIVMSVCSIRVNFPEVRQRLSNERKLLWAINKESRNKDLIKAICELSSMGIYPSKRVLHKHLGRDILNRKETRIIWRKTLMELGISPKIFGYNGQTNSEG